MKQYQLKIINVDNILPHEEFDISRSSALVEKIKEKKQLSNPILVAHVADETYVQIDGMNRYSAIKQLGIPCIVAQVVDYNDPNVLDISTWAHLHDIDKKTFLKMLSAVPNIDISQSGFRYLRRRFIKDSGLGYLCTIVFNDLSVYRIATSGKLPQKVTTLCNVVSTYKKQITRDVLPDDANSVDVSELFKKQHKKTLVLFPTFTRHQIIECATRAHVLFPGGVTRFIIKNRCLNVNLPLDLLKSKDSIEIKNKKLEEFLGQKKLRVYEEPTIYFER